MSMRTRPFTSNNRTSKPYLAIASLILLLMGSCREQQEPFQIPEGYVGMFGYGSLMSKNFIETGLLGGTYEGPFLPAHLNGYKRSWTFAWPSDIPAATADGHYYKAAVVVRGDTLYPRFLHYLNIREAAGSTLNGVLYMVPEKDLPIYDRWEPGYERFEVTALITGYRVEGGPVYAYRALPGFEGEPDGDVARNAIERDYLDIIQQAFDYWGAGFEAEYRQSTEPVDANIIGEIVKIPWENPPLEQVEELMRQFEYNNHPTP